VGHRRAKLTVEGRKLLVERVRQQGWTVATAAEAQGCSRATAHKWLRRFDVEGAEGLRDRSSRPFRCPRRLGHDVEEAIIDRRRSMLEGPHRISWALGVPRSTVHKVLRRNDIPRLADLDRATRTVVRYERERPGELLHVDVKKQGRIPAGGGWWAHGKQVGRRNSLTYRRRIGGDRRRSYLGFDHLHIAVDDRSRIAYAEALADETKEAAAGFMERALEWFSDLGIQVERVMTDNGSAYRSRLFRGVLEAADIKHKRTRPYRPQTNGKVERFNLTLKHEWAYAAAYDSNQARLDFLESWLHHYNHHRAHMAHDGEAPMSVVNNVCGKHN
jgi:transposase InsO family protein